MTFEASDITLPPDPPEYFDNPAEAISISKNYISLLSYISLHEMRPYNYGGKTVFSESQIINNLSGYGTTSIWTGNNITYSFPTNMNWWPSAGETAGFSALTPVQQNIAHLTMDSFNEIIAPGFSFSGYNAGGTLKFSNTTTNIGYAHAYYPSNYVSGGSIWFYSSYPDNTLAVPKVGEYGFITYLHEAGHALGVSHPGSYNGGFPSYSNDAEYEQDSRMFSVMSYFNADETGGYHFGYDNQWHYAQTLLMDDILTLQTRYGADLYTRNDNTIYGFNSTSVGSVYDFSKNKTPIICIYDAGGNDTLDLSGYSTSSFINLRPGSFSDAAGMTYNLSIARGTIIENAVGGAADDVIVGNSVGNIIHSGGGNDYIFGDAGNDDLYGDNGNDFLVGGSGDDQIDGGAGIDIVGFSGAKSDYRFENSPNGYIVAVDQRNTVDADGSDKLLNIEKLSFSDGTFDLKDLVDLRSRVTISTSSASVLEESKSFSFTVSLDVAASTQQTVAYTVSGNGPDAADAKDFGSKFPTGTVTFKPGETTKIVTIPIVNDTIEEKDEGFSVTLSKPSAGLLLGDTVKVDAVIENHDVTPRATISTSSASVLEESKSFSFTVSLDVAASTQQTVAYTVSGNGPDAADAKDFGSKFPTGTVTFKPGETTKIVTIPIVNDTIEEKDEGFSVTLSKPSAGLLLGDTVKVDGVIENHDVTPRATISTSSASVLEESKSFSFTVSLDVAASTQQTVTYTVSGNGPDAADAKDFGSKFPTGTVTFKPGETTKIVTIPIVNDTIEEKDEGFSVTLSKPSAGLLLGDTVKVDGVIENHDVTPRATISTSSASVLEESKSFSFTVSLDVAASTQQTVTYTVSGNGPDAADAKDFGSKFPTGTVTFKPGETTKIVTIPIVNDTIEEKDEGFSVTLSKPSAGLLLGDTVKVDGVIENHDVTPRATISTSLASVTEESKSFSFTVSLDVAASTQQTVAYTVSGNGPDAADAKDFGSKFPTGTVTFKPGETTKIVTIPIVNDTIEEKDEGFSVTLSKPSAGLLLGDTVKVDGVIENHDVTPRATISTSLASVTEESKSFSFTVSLDVAASTQQTVAYTVSGNGPDAADAKDFGSKFPTGTVTFKPGETTKIVTIPIVNDTIEEKDEGFSVTLSKPSAGLLLGDTVKVDGVILDNDASGKIFSLTPQMVADGHITVSGVNGHIDKLDFRPLMSTGEALDWFDRQVHAKWSEGDFSHSRLFWFNNFTEGHFLFDEDGDSMTMDDSLEVIFTGSQLSDIQWLWER